MYILKDHYLFLFFLLHIALAAIAFFISSKGSKGLDRIGVWLIALSYVLIVFTRQGLGVDETTYRAAYIAYLSDPSLVEFEYSFKFLFYCLKELAVSPDNFNNLICCLYIFLVLVLVQKTVESPLKTLCILLFLFSSVSLDFIFNAYRQGFAFVFVYASLMAYRSGKKKFSLLYMVIAVGFHWSSILIPLLLLSFRLVPKRAVKIVLMVVIILTFMGFLFPLGILPTLNKILSFIPYKNYYLDKISFYLTTSESSIYGLNFFGRLPLLLNTLVIIFIGRYSYRYVDFIWVKLIAATGLYCVIFMEMSFSFRNYYWLLPLLPFVICNALTNFRKLDGQRYDLYVQYIGLVVLSHIAISFLTYYTSPLIPLVFLDS